MNESSDEIICTSVNGSNIGFVLDAAQRAWSFYNERIKIESIPVNGHTKVASIVAINAKRIEFVVGDDDPDVWDTLASIEVCETWQLCALVPMRLLGTAHERLRENHFELQGWWLSRNHISFGTREVA